MYIVKMSNESQEGDKKSPNEDPRQFWQGPSKDGGKPSFKPPKNRVALVVFVTLAILFAYMFFDSAGGRSEQSVPYTTFISYVEANQVSQVEIKEQSQVRFVLKNGIAAQTRIPYFDETLLSTLKEKGVSVTGTVAEISVLQVVLQLLPWIIFIGFTIMLYRQSSGLNGKMMSTLGKSRAKEYMEGDTKITFADVAGQVEAPSMSWRRSCNSQTSRPIHQNWGEDSRGVMLVGPPGTGKTLWQGGRRRERGLLLPHQWPDFVEMFVGMGRHGYATSLNRRKNAPCILFIDELDAWDAPVAVDWVVETMSGTDAQPNPRRDGRALHHRRRHCHGGDQPTRYP